ALIDEEGKLPFLSGIITETTNYRRLLAIEELEKNIFRLYIDKPISELLLSYLKGLEVLFPRMQCSILMIKNGRLYDGISPSLAKAYMAAIENQPISENTGSCGAAAALKKQIIVSDISTDPKWTDYREVALTHGLKACWSNPLISTDG